MEHFGAQNYCFSALLWLFSLDFSEIVPDGMHWKLVLIYFFIVKGNSYYAQNKVNGSFLGPKSKF